MKKIRCFDINSILECKHLFFRMPESIRKKQLELREQIDALRTVDFDNDRMFNNTSFPVISDDEMWAKLSSSEKDLVQSLENGSVPEAAESYHSTKAQNGHVSNKS